LALGLALAFPLITINKYVASKPDLSVNVVYAYFGAQNYNPSITGLYRNYSNPQHFVTENTNGMMTGNTVYDVDAVSYFMVLNITNLSNQNAYVNAIDTLVGPSVSASSNGSQTVLGASNPLISDSRVVSAYAGWGNIWGPNVSRLIYLSGIIGSLNISYSLIQNHIWAYVQINGDIYSNGNVPINGVDYEQLPLQSFGQDHLYNNLVGENQTLIFLNEFDVSVGRLVQ
jgi:hypothetical protein